MLTGEEIIRQIRKGEITIDPFHINHVGPNSVDLTLAPTLMCYEDLVLDMKSPPATQEIKIHPEEGYVIQPNVGYLGVTQEIAGCSSKFVPFIDGRSSIGRLFIDVHATAGRGDRGFVNRWTLEITAKAKPVRIYPGVRIAQIYFFEAQGDCARMYQGKYKTSLEAKPTPSRLYQDFLHHEG